MGCIKIKACQIEKKIYLGWGKVICVGWDLKKSLLYVRLFEGHRRMKS